MADIYDRHGAGVHRLAHYLRRRDGTDEVDGADEVVRTVFVRLWECPSSYEPAGGSLRSFLMRQTHICSTELIAHDPRTSAGEIVGDPLSRDPLADETALAHLAGASAWALLAGLGAEGRSTIVLAYFGGYTYREIAALLAQLEATITSHMRTALTRLRHQMTPPGTALPAVPVPNGSGDQRGR